MGKDSNNKVDPQTGQPVITTVADVSQQLGGTPASWQDLVSLSQQPGFDTTRFYQTLQDILRRDGANKTPGNGGRGA